MRPFLKLAISIALIVVPVILVFRNLFMPGPLAWGDAPYFYPGGIKELIAEPLAWTQRGESFGGVNSVIFLWPLMFLYGLIGNNDIAIRVLFYFPSIIFAGLGTYLLTRYLKFSKTVQFFSVLFYILNTYFILLIDGGQVGFALAYGFFPVALCFLKKFLDRPNFNAFFLSLALSFALTSFDPRVSVICLIVVVLWQILELKFKSLKFMVIFIGALLALNLYWIYPLVENSLSGEVLSSGTLIKWYYPLTLFSPNWPSNLFGVSVRPPIYFFLVPLLLILGGLRQKRIGVLFLIFAILTFGFIPFGSLPFGFALRDSTKFFIPLVLFAGILIGRAVEKFNHVIVRIVVYLFILFLIYPVLLGKMNFVLSSRIHSDDLQKIYENLKADKSFYQTVWFPEKYPISYETVDHPAVNAKDLAGFRPFASFNAGEDVFNFLNNKDFPEWFKVLGIKYLILSDNPRQVTKSEKDQKDWNTITSLIDKNENLEKLDWGTSVPVYRVKGDTHPKFYAVDRLILVVGPELPVTEHRSLATVYSDDGKWDPSLLQGKSKDSVKILFNGGDKLDLAMSFLQKYFIPVSETKKNEWAYYSSKDYLKYKYELLIRGYTFRDFDYGAGIAFSTKVGEKIQFDAKKDSSDIYFIRKANKDEALHWEQIDSSLTIENKSDLGIVNIAAVVPKIEYEKALKLADTYINYFGTITADSLKEKQVTAVPMKKFGALKYKFSAPDNAYWIVFNESYHPLWQLSRGIKRLPSFPVFSMVNGFYVDPEWSDLGIEFKGQENVRWGMYFSVISALVLAIIYLWKKSNKP